MTIAINGDRTWWVNVNSAAPAGYYDLWSVLAHEFGHTLALNEAQAYVNCDGYALSVRPTMCSGTGAGTIWKRSLEAYDINHERNLYG